ncbi:hypothetical protein L0337_45875, partial [candidate division KSB1 bacterium]|nr:hypothetical protein [candidate division KSB1 bacterium]
MLSQNGTAALFSRSKSAFDQLTEASFRVCPLKANRSSVFRLAPGFLQLVGVFIWPHRYIVVNKQRFVSCHRFGRDSFVSRSSRKEWLARRHHSDTVKCRNDTKAQSGLPVKWDYLTG